MEKCSDMKIHSVASDIQTFLDNYKKGKAKEKSQKEKKKDRKD